MEVLPDIMKSSIVLGALLEYALYGAIGLVALIIALVLFKFLGVWIRARVANAPVGILTLIAMSLRRVPVSLIVDSRITAVKAGIPVDTDPLEAHYLAGGNVNEVVLALLSGVSNGRTSRMTG